MSTSAFTTSRAASSIDNRDDTSKICVPGRNDKQRCAHPKLSLLGLRSRLPPCEADELFFRVFFSFFRDDHSPSLFFFLLADLRSSPSLRVVPPSVLLVRWETGYSRNGTKTKMKGKSKKQQKPTNFMARFRKNAYSGDHFEERWIFPHVCDLTPKIPVFYND